MGFHRLYTGSPRLMNGCLATVHSYDGTRYFWPGFEIWMATHLSQSFDCILGAWQPACICSSPRTRDCDLWLFFFLLETGCVLPISNKHTPCGQVTLHGGFPFLRISLRSARGIEMDSVAWRHCFLMFFLLPAAKSLHDGTSCHMLHFAGLDREEDI